MQGRTRQTRRSHAAPRGIESPRLHLVLYSLLLVATPFIMLRNYLQDAIGRLSIARVSVAGVEIPGVPLVAATLLATALVLIRRRIRPRHVAALAVGLAMIAIAQRITDYYFGHRFYEIQVNWHYFAYATFAFMTYRDLRPRGVSLGRYVLITFALAAAYSTFDEAVQLAISSRIFDVSDIAKDTWGAVTGMAVILIGGAHPELARGGWKKLRHPTLRATLSHAPGAWLYAAMYAFCFLSVASLFTESRHAALVFGLTLATFLPAAAAVHLTQFRRWRILLAACGIVLAGLLAVSCVRSRGDSIGMQRPQLTIVHGVPIPLCDVLFLPNGAVRPVDKKHYFNTRDRDFFLRHEPDILLVGAGYRGQGGKGFPHQRGARFVYNPHSGRGTQVIILESSEACAAFERLKAEGKNVLFVLHTSC